jgi:hypothetical protein
MRKRQAPDVERRDENDEREPSAKSQRTATSVSATQARERAYVALQQEKLQIRQMEKIAKAEAKTAKKLAKKRANDALAKKMIQGGASSVSAAADDADESVREQPQPTLVENYELAKLSREKAKIAAKTQEKFVEKQVKARKKTKKHEKKEQKESEKMLKKQQKKQLKTMKKASKM